LGKGDSDFVVVADVASAAGAGMDNRGDTAAVITKTKVVVADVVNKVDGGGTMGKVGTTVACMYGVQVAYNEYRALEEG
jgi:hypothetical protein